MMLTWALLLCTLHVPVTGPPGRRPGFDAVRRTAQAPAKLKVTARTVFVVAGTEVTEQVFFATAGKVLRIDVEADGTSIRRIEAGAKGK